MPAIPLIVALDFREISSALAFARKIDPERCRLKIGKELFTATGPTAVERLQNLGFEIFLDLKFHDIPSTVAKACSSAARLGVWMLNVHALGGKEMLEAAADACSNFRVHVIAVTILTSHTPDTLAQIGLMNEPIAHHVQRLAELAQQSGCQGIVCSAQESAQIKNALGKDFITVTPGIRPKDYASDDQRRVVTVQEAISAGSDYLVVGRPITQAGDPQKTIEQLYQEIELCKLPS